MKTKTSPKVKTLSTGPARELMASARRNSGLADLAAALAVRASRWPWHGVYLRWRAGEYVGPFQRKWLAVTARHLSRRLEGRRLREADIKAVKPWPRRDQR